MECQGPQGYVAVSAQPRFSYDYTSHSNVVTLQIADVRRSDEGQYTCYFYYTDVTQSRRDEHHSAQLLVLISEFIAFCQR